jgi:hypothetical protein
MHVRDDLCIGNSSQSDTIIAHFYLTFDSFLSTSQ